MKKSRTCKVEGCHGPHEAHGYCQKHYIRFKKYGDPTVSARTGPKSCKVEGCNGAHLAVGYCKRHYYRFTRYGDPIGLPPKRKKKEKIACKVKGCGNTCHSLGYCKRHYRRFKLYGDPTGSAPKIIRNEKKCKLEDCDRAHKSLGYCAHHHHRFKKYGDPFGSAPKRKKTKKRTCKVEGCDGVHEAYGYCGRHYKRFRKYGDSTGSFPKNIITCKVEGCDGVHEARGYCANHYQLFKKYGNPTGSSDYNKPVSITVDGKTYSSLREAATASGQRPDLLFGRHKLGWSDHDIFYGRDTSKKQCKVDGCEQIAQAKGLCWNHYTKLRKHGDPNKRCYPTVTFRGVTYNTKSDLCRAYGVLLSNYCYRISHGWSQEEALALLPRPRVRYKKNKKVSGNRQPIPVIIDGVEYPSIAAVARQFGLAPDTVHGRLRKGHSIRAALGLTDHQFETKRYKRYEINGKKYNYTELESLFGVPTPTIFGRLRLGWTLREAVGADPVPAAIEFRGKHYKYLSEIAAEYGVEKHMFHSRRHKGWSIEEALGLEEREPTLEGAYNEILFERKPELKNQPATLYLVQILLDDILCYKVGMTLHSVNERLREGGTLELLYDTIATRECTLYEAYKAEQGLLDRYKEQRFVHPNHLFGGRTECLRLSKKQVEEIARLIAPR